MTGVGDEEEVDQCVSETTPLKIVVGSSRSMSQTPPITANISPTHFSPPPHVLQNRTPASAVPGRLINHKKQLRKYASETCFATRPAIQPDQPAGTGTSSTRNNSDESVPSSGRDVKTSTRVYHIRPVPATVRTSNGKTIINKINRRRQESDDGSASIASETTIASGTATPKNLKLKLKRPKSTGNMGYTNHVYGETMNSAGTVTVYDPSYTSATIHSFDSQQQHMTIPMEVAERRASNFYMDDDSLHEFDDDANGKV